MSEQATIHGFIVTRAESLTHEQRENNRKWVEALRSGKYPQGKGQLRTEDSYCCLGVACDIQGAEWVLKFGDYALDGDYFQHPSPRYQRIYGLPSDSGFYSRYPDGQGLWLTDLNDRGELTFPQIADTIAYWAGLEDPADTSVSNKGTDGSNVEGNQP